MKQIVQLEKQEYDKLIELANLNNQAVENRAVELYQERGTYGLEIDLDIQDNYKGHFSLKANSYVKDWDNKFPISEADKRKISNFVNERAKRLLVNKFGEQITKINIINDKVAHLNERARSFIVVTLTGWGLAIILTLIALWK